MPNPIVNGLRPSLGLTPALLSAYCLPIPHGANHVPTLASPRQVFVALGFEPQVGTATTGFMILFTALGGTVKYLAIGKLAWRHLLWFAFIGAIGGQTGQRVVKRVIQKTGRPSFVIFILGGIIALAVIVMTTFGTIRALDERNCGAAIWQPDASQFICKEDV
mmetsp:Transcript_14600/g.29249  ORF Transcript_14600/g.29249 Transcript_14600/m.29249 type:complete len:163 (-) Transcript_14600:221-709(-)